MFIQTEPTPNPATIKFIPDAPLLPMGQGPFDFRVGDDASDSPLAAALFNVDGVAGVMIAPDFVAVTKDENLPWDTMKTGVLMALMDHIVSGQGAVHLQSLGEGRGPLGQRVDPRAPGEITTGPSGQARGTESFDPIESQIIDLLETRVRPAVARDGGDITFSHFDDGVVYVHLRGACAGCPSSTATLKSGIENMMKHYIPSVRAVEAA